MIEKEKIDEAFELSKPLIEWMNENVHPHMRILVDNSGFEIVEALGGRMTSEFIKD